MPFIGNKPSAVPLTSADIADSIITSAKIVDGTIANADINSSAAIALSKLSTTGTASSSNYLRGDGAWTAVSSDYVLLATTDASSSASVSFDGYFSSTYDTYIIYGNAVEQDATSRLRLRVRKSNADVTAANYNAVCFGYQSSGSGDDVSVSGQTYFDLSNSTGSNTNYRTGFQTIIYNPLATYNHMIKNTTTYYRDNGNVEWIEFSGFCNNNQNALSGVTYYPSTGNFDSGTIVLYGVKK